LKRIGMVLPTSGYAPAEINRRQRLIERYLPAGAEFRILVPPDSPEFLDEAHHFGEAISAAGALVQTLSPRDYGAVILAGALDPGLSAARSLSPVPVVGPGEASMFLAWQIGRPLSIVTVDEHAVAATGTMLDTLALAPPITSIRSLQMPVRTVMQDFEAAGARLRDACTKAVREDGAQAIFLGAMILGMLPISDSLQGDLDVPVIDPVRVAVAMAVQLAQVSV
jgi:allantoin racemase